MGDIVYLDICCFKRPFDDAAVERVRREAGLVAAILEAVQGGSLRLVRSPAHDFENERNPREDRRLATRLWLDAADTRVAVDTTVALRAQTLAALGFGPLDALHLACAEHVAARWFVTTDDPLLRRARALREELRVTVVPPDGVVLPGKGETRMSSPSSMSLYEIRMEGWKALTERLGPAGAMRFMMQYDPGHGDYSKERHELFATLTMDELLEAVRPNSTRSTGKS